MLMIGRKWLVLITGALLLAGLSFLLNLPHHASDDALPSTPLTAGRPRVVRPVQPISIPALRAAIQDLTDSFPDRYRIGADCLTRLAVLETRLAQSGGIPALGDQEAVRRFNALAGELDALQREALVAHPALAGREVLFVCRAQYAPEHHNTETLFQTGEDNVANFRGGGALKALDLKTGRVRTLLETREGVIRDPEVHFSGGKIVFSMRRNIRDDYKIYEIGADGHGLKQLTFAEGVSDIDPLYLPDDSIVFSSTREPKYCMCNIHIMANLYRMDPDGANIHQIGKNTLFEGHGSLLPDGRLLYDRWEYVDRNYGDAQGLWTMNPDGTHHALYWGNNTPAPGGVIEARVIPGTQQVIAVLSSSHDRPWGALGIIDRRLGLDGRAPVIRTWPPAAANLITTAGANIFDRFVQTYPDKQYEDPFPLQDLETGAGAGRYFLCSHIAGPNERMGLYLIDVQGNEALLHVEGRGCYDPMPLAPSPRPPLLPSRRDDAGDQGIFYIADVYRGVTQGVRRGDVKTIRIVEEPEKRHWTRPAWGGQGVQRPAMNWHDFNAKRILGTVPVAEDGSAYFQVPAGRFVYFQLLDASGMMIQSMRSGTLVQPGERAGCIGCHDERRSASPWSMRGVPQALRRPPAALSPGPGAERNFNYLAEVQPVFNRHCLACHDYGKPAAARLNLAPDRDLVFNTAYNELWRKGLTGAIGAGPAQIQPPGSWGSRTSRLIQVLRGGHQGVRLDRESFDRLVTWIDLNAPYYPDYASAWPEGLAGRAPLDDQQLKRLADLTRTPFAELATFHTNTGPQVCFDRPELSPCLAALQATEPKAYREALAIIRQGQAALARNPNPDAPGFTPCETDRRREDKYARLRRAELGNLKAIREGRKSYDPPPEH